MTTHRHAAHAFALALAVLALSLPATIAGAGPWAQGKGKLYTELTWSRLSTDRLATPDGTVHDIPTFELKETRFYGEIGLAEKLTVLGSFPFDHRSSIDGFGSASGVGDLRIGLQYQLGQTGSTVYAVRGIVQAPTGDESKGEGLLPTGSGAWEGEASFGIGHGFGRGWAFVESGYQARAKRLHDALLYLAEVGVHATSFLDLSFRVNGIEPFEKGQSADALGSAAGLGDGVTYFKYGPGAHLSLGSGLGIAGWIEWTAHARNLARGTTYRFGVTYKSRS